MVIRCRHQMMRHEIDVRLAMHMFIPSAKNVCGKKMAWDVSDMQAANGHKDLTKRNDRVLSALSTK